MTNAEEPRPTVATIRFNAYEVSVLDVYPPAYMLSSEVSDTLRAYGLEGYAEVSPDRSKPLEDRTRFLVLRKDESIENVVYAEDGQTLLIHGPGDFSIS